MFREKTHFTITHLCEAKLKYWMNLNWMCEPALFTSMFASLCLFSWQEISTETLSSVCQAAIECIFIGGTVWSGFLPKGDHKQQRRKEKWLIHLKQPKKEGPKYHGGHQPPSTRRTQLPQRVVNETTCRNALCDAHISMSKMQTKQENKEHH